MHGEIRKREGIERKKLFYLILFFFLVEGLNECLFCFGFVSVSRRNRVSMLWEGGMDKGEELSDC